MLGAGALMAFLGDVVRDEQVRVRQAVGGQPIGTLDGGAQVRPYGLLNGVRDFLETANGGGGPSGGRRSQIIPKPIPATFREAKSAR
ncbi:hypothetical protein AHiyo4_42170 [Arthrobacter sp. Hiyo4]|nr:hypothetical protein AHiyo4_42170 [Arthrobacter sp. Hiyo4]